VVSKHEQWVDDLLGNEEPPRRVPTAFERELLPSRWDKPLSIGLAIAGALAIIGAYADDWNPWFLFLGVLCFGLVILFSYTKTKVGQTFAAQRDDDLTFAREIYRERMGYRLSALSTLSGVEIERYRTQGAFDAAQLSYLQEQGLIVLNQQEAARVRAHEQAMATLQQRFQASESAQQRAHEATQARASYDFQSTESSRDRSWKSAESERDRRQAIEVLITRFEGDIKKLQAQMELARPDAYVQMEQEMIVIEGRLKQLQKINEITDDRLRRQMFEQFKRQWKL
jgi:hypothetical protein